MSKESKKNARSTVGGTAGTVCKCRKPSFMIGAVYVKEKARAYNNLSKLMREILTETLINHDKGRISAKALSLDIRGETYGAYILYAEPDDKSNNESLFDKSTEDMPLYFLAWTCDGVAEFENGVFSRYVEFNDISYADSADALNHCHCNGNTLDFFTLSGLFINLISSNLKNSLGFSEHSISRWCQESEDCLRLYEFLNSTI